ncbi:MAG: AMP-binding protein, partial [Gammaproteobacteria bacterium]|nr:AMP-binding protein [Gammaproteobacteria bacterium]
MSEIPFPYLQNNSDRTALVEGNDSYTFSEVNDRINRFASGLLGENNDLQEERIAFFMPASLNYVTTMHGVWRAGGIAVPLNVASAVSELDHYLTCASVTRMIANAEYQEMLKELCDSLNIQLVSVEDVLADEAGNLPEIAPERRAMMLFTSGTTNKPKGVVSTHKTIRAQITTLIASWSWTEDDGIPLFL